MGNEALDGSTSLKIRVNTNKYTPIQEIPGIGESYCLLINAFFGYLFSVMEELENPAFNAITTAWVNHTEIVMRDIVGLTNIGTVCQLAADLKFSELKDRLKDVYEDNLDYAKNLELADDPPYSWELLFSELSLLS